MAGYIPLFNSLISSSVWNEDSDTCKVWITLMAMSDKNGIVEGSVVGVAPIARVSTESCQKAIEILKSPDPNSRSKEYEGRRILEISGGWRLVNHKKYRDLAKSRAAYYQLWRKEKEERSKEEKEQTHTQTAQHSATLSEHGFVAPIADIQTKTQTGILAPQVKEPPFKIATPEQREIIRKKQGFSLPRDNQ